MQQSAPEYNAFQSGAPGSARVLSEEHPSEATPAEGPMGEAQTVHLASGLPRLVLTITVNLLVLAEVFIAMYFAAQNPDEITPIFFKVLFTLLLPTLVLAFVAKRILARRGKR